MIALFTIITRKYRVFRESVRCGDDIVVEHLYEYFIPLWLMTGKQNYVEIGLSQIEDLYGRVPYHILQAIVNPLSNLNNLRGDCSPSVGIINILLKRGLLQ